MLIAEANINSLDHGNARSGHPCYRGNIVARHECFADPQVPEAVDRDLGSDFSNLFLRRNLLDTIEPFCKPFPIERLSIAVDENMVVFDLAFAVILEDSQGLGVQSDVPDRGRSLRSRPLVLTEDDLAGTKQEIGNPALGQLVGSGTCPLVGAEHVSEGAIGILFHGAWLLGAEAMEGIEVNLGGGEESLDFFIGNEVTLCQGFRRYENPLDATEGAIDRRQVWRGRRIFRGPIPAVLDGGLGVTPSLV